MTCGIYGLVCPFTGRVRYVGASKDIERAYKRICETPWKAFAAGPQLDWSATLRRQGAVPNLRIIAKTEEANFNAEKARWVGIYELTGEADLNINFSAKTQKSARSKKVG